MNNKPVIGSDKKADIFNINNSFLSKLDKPTPSEQQTVSDSVKADLRLDSALSNPSTQNGMGYVGALDLNKNILPDRASDNQKPDKIPLHEKVDEVKPKEDLEYYKEVNGLDYSIYDESSVIVKNRFETVGHELNVYTASYTKQDIIRLQLITGKAQYINGRNSYISFNLKHNLSNNDISLGYGTITNIFKKITCILSNGDVLDVLDKCNMYNDIFDNIVRGPDYMDSGLSELKGFNGNINVSVQTSTFIVQLSDILPIFNIDSLLPPSLTNFMTINIELENPDMAFTYTSEYTSKALVYSINDLKIVYDSYYLDHEFQKKVEKMPITIEYRTYETITTPTENMHNRIPLNITKSRMLNVITRAQFASYDSNDLAQLNYLKSKNEYLTNIKSTHWTVGNTKYPERPITDQADSYINVLKTFGNLNANVNTISYFNFKTLDNCDVLNLNRAFASIEGIPVNNVNNIVYNYVLDDNTKIYIYNFFCTFMKRVNVYPYGKDYNMNNSTIKFEISD